MINYELLNQMTVGTVLSLKAHLITRCPLLPTSCSFPYAKPSVDSIEYLHAEKRGIYRCLSYTRMSCFIFTQVEESRAVKHTWKTAGINHHFGVFY